MLKASAIFGNDYADCTDLTQMADFNMITQIAQI